MRCVGESIRFTHVHLRAIMPCAAVHHRLCIGGGVGQPGVGRALCIAKHTDQVFKLVNTLVYIHIASPTLQVKFLATSHLSHPAFQAKIIITLCYPLTHLNKSILSDSDAFQLLFHLYINPHCQSTNQLHVLTLLNLMCYYASTVYL